MDLVSAALQVIGALVVIALAGLAVLWIAFRWWLHRRLGDAAKMVGKGYGSPPRITLHRLHGPWFDGAKVGSLRSQATALGYQPIDAYCVEEMPGVQLEAFFNPGDSSAVIVYDQPEAGVWFDVVTHYPDGTGITVSNSRAPTLPLAPGDVSIKDPDITLRGARDRLLAERRPGPFDPLGPDNFVAEFEAAYARQMDHVIGEGGVPEEFMRDSGKAVGVTHRFSDEEYAKARQVHAEELRHRAAEACLDNFLKASKLTPSQWEHCRDRAIVVHERLSPDEVVSLFCAYLSDIAHDDPRVAAVRGRTADPLGLFGELNTLLATRASYLHLGEVVTPVRAHVYLAPR